MAPAVSDFGNLKTDAGLAKLNEYMSCHSYVSGYCPSQVDVLTLGKLIVFPNRDRLPHAARWYRHISSAAPAEQKRWPKGLVKAAEPKKEEEEFDLFGEETEEEKAAAEKLAEAKRAEVKSVAAKKKKEVINKSSLVMEIKPNNVDTNLDEVLRLVKLISIDGLSWGEAHKKVPVAFGLYKLQVCCTIIDDLVNTSDITDRIEELGMTEARKVELRATRDTGGPDDDDDEEDAAGLVQSVEIVSFNKL